MNGHLVSALVVRATRAHMRSMTEGHDARYWSGARDALLSQAALIGGHTRAELKAHVDQFAASYMGADMAVALEQLRGIERRLLKILIETP